MTLKSDAEHIQMLIARSNDESISPGVRRAVEEDLVRAVQRSPAAFDSLVYPGAAKLFLSGGTKALRQEFKRRYHSKAESGHTDKQAGVVYKTGLRRLGKQATDERFLIESDTDRLAAKAEALAMPSWAHDALIMHLGTTALETIYDSALVTTGKARKLVAKADLKRRKDLSDIEQRALLIVQLTEAGIPQAVLFQISLKLGDTATRVLEALTTHIKAMKMWGKDVAQTQAIVQKAADSQVKQKTEAHPFWRTNVRR